MCGSSNTSSRLFRPGMENADRGKPGLGEACPALHCLDCLSLLSDL